MYFFLGGTGGGSTVTKLKSIFAKTRVGFGRTELSLSAMGTTVCALSSGHGPRGRGFQGFSKTLVFITFFRGRKCNKKENMEMQDEHG